MAKKMKRSLALLLALVLCLGMLPMSVFAAEVPTHEHNEDGWVCTQAEGEKKLDCQHVHDEACYAPGEPVLICEENHHTEDCYVPGEDVLVCESVEHKHTDACYAVVRGELTCAAAEHTHDEDCYDEDDSLTCMVEEHTHGDACYAAERGELTCEQAEHTHDEDCYAPGESVLVCEEDHHTEECYAPGEDVLICVDENGEHKHTDECYETVEGEWTCVNVVGEFLAAVAELPDVEDVTAENAEEIGEQVNAVLDMAEALREDYYAREDVTEALNTVYAVFEAVLEAEDIDDANLYSTTWDGVSVSTEFGKGSGTEDDPYLIESAADLAYLAQLTWEKANANNLTRNKYYMLTVDIDLANHEWTPIGGMRGTGNYSFQGHFIGGGHTISNLKIGNPEDDESRYRTQTSGLFGSIDYTAEICDLKLDGVTITRPSGNFYTTGGDSGAGALVGLSRLGNMKLICNITVSNATISWDNYAGGIVGNDQTYTTIKKCSVRNCTISAASNAWGKGWGAGGIIGGLSMGSSTGKTSIFGCSSKDNSIFSTHGGAGGIVGSRGVPTSPSTAGSLKIERCYNTSSVWYTSVADVKYYAAGAGGIIGYNKADKIEVWDCFNYGTITAPAGNSTNKSYAGGIVGYGQGFKISFVGNTTNLQSAGTDTMKNCHNAGKVTTSSTNKANKSYVMLANLNAYGETTPNNSNNYKNQWEYCKNLGNTYLEELTSDYATVRTTAEAKYAVKDETKTFTPIDPCVGPPVCTCGCHCSVHPGDGPDGPDVQPVTVDYTLTYDANGGAFEGSVTTKTDTVNAAKDAASVTFTIKNFTPEWENHTFKGWATTSGATEVEYVYGETGKDQVTFTPPTSDMKLYAVWEENPLTPPEPENPALTGITKALTGVRVNGVDKGTTVPTLTVGDEIELTYTITVTGEEGANYTVTDPGAKLNDTDADTVSGTIPTGQTSVEITATKTVTVAADTASISNTAYVKSGDNTDPIAPADPENDPTDPDKGYPSNPVETDVTVTVPNPGLNVTKRIKSEVGDTVTYEITVTNTGDVTLYNTMLVDTMEKVLTPTDPTMASVNVTVANNDGNDNAVELLGVRDDVKAPKRVNGLIEWNELGGLTRTTGDDMWDFTWMLEGAFEVGATMTLTYSATITYPENADTVTYRNWADAIAGTDEDDVPAYDGWKISARDFVSGGSGAVGSGSGEVVGQQTKYTLIYDFDGGTWTKNGVTYNAGNQYKVEQWSTTGFYTFHVDGTVQPTKAGYTFQNKWTQGGSTYQANAEVTATSANKVVTIKAVWNANPVVTFDPNGGNWGGNTDNKTVATDTEGKVTPPADPEQDNKVFDGWYTDPTGGDKVDVENTTFTEDTTLYAHWIETHTVTVWYMNGDSNTPFRADVTLSYKLAEGQTYNHQVDPEKTTYVMKEDFGPGVLSPQKFTFASGTTYVFDEVMTTDALTGEMGDEDVVIKVYYSKDNKGTDPNDPTKDSPDGTPDKYQAKVVYTATEGGSQNGVNTYATIMSNGSMATEGTISIAGATATANSGHYFVNWTAKATGHNGWSYAASDNATLAADNNVSAKGNAVYTFTANFAEKTALTVEIVGNTDTVTYNGNEQSVTGYTMTVKDKDGNEITLPDGLTVTPASNDSVAKGTAVGDYDMGLKQDSFVLTGDDAGKYTVSFTVTDGKLTIVPRDTALSVSAGNVETTYDGEGHTVTPVVTFNGQEVTDLDANGITVTVTYTKEDGTVITGEPTDAGTYTANITAKKAGEKDATGTATVTINKATLTVNTNSASKTYDGTALTAGGNISGMVNGETVTVATTKSLTDAGSVSNDEYTLTWGTAKESNYTVSKGTMGTLTVNKATLTVTTDSASKVHDGNPLTAPGRIDGLVGEETVTFTVTGSQTEVGVSDNTYTLAWDGTAKENNYTVTEGTIGTLTVTAPVIVIPDPVDTTYTLNYNANGGEGAPASQSQLNSNVFTVSGGEPTREGYTFQGWATTPDGAVSYQAGSNITITGLSQTLYAVWQQDEEDITDENPPLTELPDTGEENPDADLPKDPTEELPDEEDISDEDVPLTDVPKTGDHTNRFLVMAAVSGLCLLTLLSGRKKEDEA